MKTLKIESVQHVRDYQLSLTFNDGKKQIVDFALFLKSSQHPEIKKYLNKKNFLSYRIENGDLMWGDFDLIFPIIDLYKNSISKKAKSNSKSAS